MVNNFLFKDMVRFKNFSVDTRVYVTGRPPGRFYEHYTLITNTFKSLFIVLGSMNFASAKVYNKNIIFFK